MFSLILSIFLTALPDAEGLAGNDAQLLMATIESLQQPVEDFRCEFEGTLRFKGKIAEYTKVGEDGLFMSFSGVFIWKKGGDVHMESLRRQAADGRIMRESLVVRMRQQQAEQYGRDNDAPLGYAVIKTPDDVRNSLAGTGSLGSIFLIDKLRRDVADDTLECSVSDDQIDDRPLKVLSIAYKGLPNLVLLRYWIDLRRNGHVVRKEGYSQGEVITGRTDIKLAPFKVGNAEVWMPVSGESVGYAALEDKKPIITKEPTSFDTIHVVGGTMEFNKGPGPEVFTIKYKPGTPISDNLRKLQYEFGQQQIGLNPTKAEMEKMLKEQVAKAEQQKTELVVASPSEGIDWKPWIAWGFGALVLISSLLLWIQRRGH